ncbi:NrtA/SsuA/CpmA family ABC transporter substrate-binding protein [Desulfobulbus sp.]|uniref:ABC transporter substrate-binding protein n=1 Tax=Desulfobulbus sp. TaxID=895 RepID=UPI00286EF020|nr:NrtA/SsuA/CpmA family ABC transporter substrate-binding protein [Desulfobulbus sp.]
MRTVTAILASVLLVTLCLSVPVRADRYRVGTWKTAQTIQPFFYREFLAKEDTVSVSPFTNPADQKTALLAGSLDMTGTTLAHAIQSAAMDQPVVVVAALCNKCSALVVRADGPIRQVADLAGKRVGYVPGTMHEILLRETLGQSGLAPGRDLTLVRIDFFDMGTALAQGAIDAFLSGEPFPSLSVAQGYGRILGHPYFDESVGTINGAMLVTREMIDRHPERVRQLVGAHARATELLKRDRNRWLQAAEAFGTPRPVLERAADNIELAWKMDADFVRKARNLGARMQALGFIDRQPDYDRLFDLRFVAEAEREVRP